MQVCYSLVVTARDGSSHTVAVSDLPITVGRLPTSTIRVDESPVSRQHCVIIPTGGGLTVLDQGSTNGTYVNGFRRQHARLQHDDEVRVGKTTILVEAKTENKAVKPTQPPEKLSTVGSVSCPSSPEDQLAYLVDMTNRLAREDDRNRARGLVLEEILDTFPVNRALLLMQADGYETNRPIVLDVRNTTDSPLPADVFNRKLLKKVMKTGAPAKVVASKKERLSESSSSSSRHIWGSALCAPVWYEGVITGALYADNLHPNESLDRAEVLNLFGAIANVTSLVLLPDGSSSGEFEGIDSFEQANRSTSVDDVEALPDEAQKLAAQKIKLAERLHQLEHLEKARATLSRGLVHDIKNLIGALNSNHSFIRGSLEANSDEMEAMDDAVEIARRIVDMSEDVLAVSRMEDGSFPLATRVVNAQQLLTRTLRRHASHAREQDVSVALGPIEEGLEIIVDPSLVDRMLDNLIGNAIRHAGDDGWVILGAGSNGTHAELIVSDSGPSVPPDQREQVFTEWYCTESTQARHHGIGLYFCRVASEAHGGTIRVEGTPGDNRFVISFPSPPDDDAGISTIITQTSELKLPKS